MSVLFNQTSLKEKTQHIRGAYDKFPDFFRIGILNCRRLLRIQYVIAIHLMR